MVSIGIVEAENLGDLAVRTGDTATTAPDTTSGVAQRGNMPKCTSAG